MASTRGITWGPFDNQFEAKLVVHLLVPVGDDSFLKVIVVCMFYLKLIDNSID